MSRPFEIAVGGTNVTTSVPWETVMVEMTGTVQQATMEFDVYDGSLAASYVTDGATVVYTEGAYTDFTGVVIDRTPTITGLGRMIHVIAVDLGQLLDQRLVPYDSRGAESDKDRLEYLMGAYGDGLSADYSQISETNASVVAQTFTNMTLRAAIESVCCQASSTTRYWIDGAARLATANNFPSAAPYTVWIRTDPTATMVAPEDLQIEWDSSALVNAYYVRGATAAGTGWVTDAASISTYGRREAYLDAPDADTGSKRDAVGNAALADTADPIARGSFTVASPYDDWRPAQIVTVTSAAHGITNTSYRILKVTKKYIGPSTRSYTVEFGGAGAQFTLLSEGPQPQGMLGSTATGYLGGSTAVSLPSNAGVYVTREGIAVSDGTMERVRIGLLTPPDTYGMGMKDEWGETLLTPSGFGSPWLDFIQSGGIYNNKFVAAASGGKSYYDAVMALEPVGCWALAESTGTTAEDFSATGVDGAYVNTPTLDVAGPLTNDPATGVTFAAASTEHVTIADNAAWDFGTGDYSIACWIKRADSPTSAEYVLSRPTGTTDGFDMAFPASSRLRSRLGALNVYSAYGISNGAWRHVVVSMDRDGNGQYYIDGVASGSPVNISGEAARDLTSADIIYVAVSDGTNYPLDGSMCQLALFDKALSSDEVAALYSAATTGPVLLTVGTSRDDTAGRTDSLPGWTIWADSGSAQAGVIDDPDWPGGHKVEFRFAATGAVDANNIAFTSDKFVVSPGFQVKLDLMRSGLLPAGVTLNFRKSMRFYDADETYISSYTQDAVISTIAMAITGTPPFIAPANARYGRAEYIFWQTVAHGSATHARAGSVALTPGGNGFGDFYYGMSVNGATSWARYVSLGDSYIQAVADGSTTAGSIGITSCAEMTALPIQGVVAVDVAVYCASSTANAGNYVACHDYAVTAGGVTKVTAINGAVAGHQTVNTGMVTTGGTNNRQIKYSVVRAAGTITYYIRVLGYWTSTSTTATS
mgnify:CR=1 FL=1